MSSYYGGGFAEWIDDSFNVVLARTVLLRIPLDPMRIDVSIDPQRNVLREFFTGHDNEMNASLRSTFDETCSRCREPRTLNITAVIYGDGHVTFEVA